MRRFFCLVLVRGCARRWRPIAQPAGDEAAIQLGVGCAGGGLESRGHPAFMQTYEDSPETTFIGASVRRGYGPILERYKKAYTTPAQWAR